MGNYLDRIKSWFRKVKVSAALRWIGFRGAIWSDGSREAQVTSFIENSGVYSVVSYITDIASAAPFQVYRVKNKSALKRYKAWTGRNATKESIEKAMMLKEKIFELDENHPMNKLLDRPNEFQTQSSFNANSIGFRLITGERFWMINKLTMGANEGRPFGVYNLPPQYMNVVGDGTMFGISGYELTIGTVQPVAKDSVIFNRKWTPQFGTAGEHLRGLSPLKAASKDVDRYAAATDKSVSMLQNQGAAGVLFNKEWSEDEAIENSGALKYKLNTEVLGSENTGKIAVANGDLGYINFGLNTKDLAIEEMERLSFERICNVYHVPPGLFNPDKATLNNAKEFKKEIITMAVIPELSALRDDYNELAKLYPEEDLYIDFDISVYPEMQDDLEKLATIMTQAWWFTPNEKRVKMGADQDDDVEMMNKYIVPSGMVKIEDLDTDELDRQLEREIAAVGRTGISDNPNGKE